MPSEFDTVIDRSGTHAFKWEFRRHCLERDIIPLWVADMDFEAPEPVRRAVQERAAHGIYGYTLLPDSYIQSVISWMGRVIYSLTLAGGIVEQHHAAGA